MTATTTELTQGLVIAAAAPPAAANGTHPTPRDEGRPSPPEHARPSEPRVTLLLPVAALLIPLLMLAGGSWLTWRSVLREATAELSRAADVGAEYATRILEGYALTAGRVNDRLQGLSDEDIRADEFTLHQALRQVMQDLPQGDVGYVIDRDGYSLLASNLYPARRGMSLTNRDYFIAQSGPNPPEVFVSQIFAGRLDDRLLFTLSRRRRGTGNANLRSDGFDGVTAIAVSPNLLGDSLRRLLAAPEDVLALVRTDGQMLARSSGQSAPLPPVPLNDTFRRLVSQGVVVFDEAPASLSAEPSLAALRRVAEFPFYAISLRPRSEIIAEWRRTTGSHLIFGIPATLMLFLLSLRVRRDQLRLSAANAVLAGDVELSTNRLSRAERFGLVGTFEIDLSSGINRRSAEYMALQGMVPTPAEERHEHWVRRLHPDDRARAEATFLSAIAAGGGTEYAQSYRIVTPAGEVRWLAARAEIERDVAGRALVMRGAHVDVTPLRSTERALAESDARLRLAQETVGIGTWEWTPVLRSLNWSRKMIELWGFDPEAGQPTMRAAVERVHPEDRGRLRREMALAPREGRLHTEFRILRPHMAGAADDATPSGNSDTVWITARARLLPSAIGDAPRLIGVAYDITERKQAEAQTELLAHEVEHRAKNALAVVVGLLRMTTAETHEDFVAVMEGRVQALARTITLLGKSRWLGANLRELVEFELTPFGAATAAGVTLEGPPVRLGVDAAQPLSMALHELATNAAKYGALSVKEGRLTIHWWVEGNQVHLQWRESGGPPLPGPPARRGFGSTLIHQIFQSQLQGDITKHWEPGGLVCEIRFSPS